MKKIVFAITSLPIGGMERVFVDYVNLLSQHYEIIVLLQNEEGELLNELNDSVTITSLERTYGFKCKNTPISIILNSIRIFKIINSIQIKADLFICFTTYNYILSRIILKQQGKKYLWVHNNLKARFHFFKFKLWRCLMNPHKYDNIVFVSHKAHETYKSCIKLFNSGVVIYNPINTSKLLRFKKNEHRCSNKFRFINISRHQEKAKRIFRILKAAKKLKCEFELELLLVGDGPDNNKYREFVTKNGLDDVVKFTGKLTNPYSLLSTSDALILSSEYEGFGMVLYEAITLGVPIISTDIADAKMVFDKTYGYVVDRSEGEIYNAMKSFLKERYKLTESFDATKHNEKVLLDFKSLIGF